MKATAGSIDRRISVFNACNSALIFGVSWRYIIETEAAINSMKFMTRLHCAMLCFVSQDWTEQCSLHNIALACVHALFSQTA